MAFVKQPLSLSVLLAALWRASSPNVLYLYHTHTHTHTNAILICGACPTYEQPEGKTKADSGHSSDPVLGQLPHKIMSHSQSEPAQNT